jgi:hypothetical protein
VTEKGVPYHGLEEGFVNIGHLSKKCSLVSFPVPQLKFNDTFTDYKLRKHEIVLIFHIEKLFL